MRKYLLIISAVLSFVIIGHSVLSAKEEAALREFTSVNIQYRGSKVWVPATFIAQKGDRIKINLITNAPSGQHGFAIDEYKIKTVAVKGEPKTVEFTADKPGIFRIYCHIHPAHVGGQLLVLKQGK